MGVWSSGGGGGGSCSRWFRRCRLCRRVDVDVDVDVVGWLFVWLVVLRCGVFDRSMRGGKHPSHGLHIMLALGIGVIFLAYLMYIYRV